MTRTRRGGRRAWWSLVVVAVVLAPSGDVHAFRPDAEAGRWGTILDFGHLDRVQEAGLSWVREVAHWCEVEAPPARGSYDFARLDARVRALDEAGLNVVLWLMPNDVGALGATADCAWTRLPDATGQRPRSALHFYPPRDVAHWAEFVTAVVRHYDGVAAPEVRHFEVVSENDTGEPWGVAFGGTPAEYYDEYQATTYRAVHEAAAGRPVHVIGGSPSDFQGLAAEAIARRAARFAHDRDGTLAWANDVFGAFEDHTTHREDGAPEDGPLFSDYEELTRWALSSDPRDDRPARGLPGQRARRFVERWLTSSDHFDVLGVHLYLGAPSEAAREALWDLIDAAARGKPVWVKDLGFLDRDRLVPVASGPSGVDDDRSIAVGRFKSTTVALAHGAAKVFFTPFIDAGDGRALPGLLTDPVAPRPRVAADVIRSLTDRVRPGAMELWRADVVPPRVVVYFRDPASGERLAVAWMDSDEPADLAVPVTPGVPVEVVDVFGAPFEHRIVFGNQVNLRLGRLPVLLTWTGPPATPTPTPTATATPSQTPDPTATPAPTPTPTSPRTPTPSLTVIPSETTPPRDGRRGFGGCAMTAGWGAQLIAPAVLSWLLTRRRRTR